MKELSAARWSSLLVTPFRPIGASGSCAGPSLRECARMTNIPEDNSAAIRIQVELEMARRQTLSNARIVVVLSSGLALAAIVIGALFVVFALSRDTSEGRFAAASGLAVTALFLTVMQLARVIGSYVGYQARKDE